MPTVYKRLSTATIAAGGSVPVTFSNIPQTYNDLLIRCSVRSADNNIYGRFQIYFNNDTSNIYSYIYMYGLGSSVTGSSQFSVNSIYGLYTNNGATSTASTFASQDIYIPNYTSSFFKSLVLDSAVENNAVTGYLTMNGGVRSSTEAITSITMTTAGTGANFSQYSTFYLYGISN